MNFFLQLILSVSEILGAITFVILIKRFRFGKHKVTIKPIGATGGETISYNVEGSSADDDILRILVINGIKVSGHSEVLKRASGSGIIYHHNMTEMPNVLKHRKAVIRVFNKQTNALNRQLLAKTPNSGILLAHLANRNMEIV